MDTLRSGNRDRAPRNDLASNDFTLSDNKHPQTISIFSLDTADPSPVTPARNTKADPPVRLIRPESR